jgi:hypothetical protein
MAWSRRFIRQPGPCASNRRSADWSWPSWPSASGHAWRCSALSPRCSLILSPMRSPDGWRSGTRRETPRASSGYLPVTASPTATRRARSPPSRPWSDTTLYDELVRSTCGSIPTRVAERGSKGILGRPHHAGFEIQERVAVGAPCARRSRRVPASFPTQCTHMRANRLVMDLREDDRVRSPSRGHLVD